MDIDIKDKKFDLTKLTLKQRGEFQEYLFSLGARWSSCGKSVRYTDKSYLFTDDLGLLGHGEWKSTFDEASEQAIKVTTSFLLEEVDPKLEEIERIESEMRKLADQLAELKEGGK